MHLICFLDLVVRSLFVISKTQFTFTVATNLFTIPFHNSQVFILDRVFATRSLATLILSKLVFIVFIFVVAFAQFKINSYYLSSNSKADLIPIRASLFLLIR